MPHSQTFPTVPVVSVATRWFGVRSEVWSWRQLRNFSQLNPTVISWKYENRVEFPLGELPIDIIGTEEEPNDTARRWLWRLRNLRSGNFFGTQGEEKRLLVLMLRRQAPKVIMCHFGQVALRLLPAARELGIPVVPHFHGHDISSSLKNPWYRRSLTRALCEFPAMVCVGSEQRRMLIELGAPECKIHVIPCGVPTADFSHVVRARGRPLTFICVSRLVEWKGISYCIDAFARAKKYLPEARLVIVGDGPELEPLQERALRLGLVDRGIEFVGSKSQSDLRKLLEQADVFLQHSLNHSSGWYEGFGVSVAEASSTGLPVIVSDCGGLTDQVIDGETGIVVPQRDSFATADAMIILGEDPDLRNRMGAKGRERMINHYDTALQISKLERVLLDVIAF